MRFSLALALCLFFPAAFADADPGERIANLGDITQSALRFLGNIQVKKADGVYVPGEWKAEVYSSPVAVVIGVGDFDGDEEPSAFTTGTIINQLALIYQDHPELSQIPPMLAAALPSLERFREGDLYNFYPPRIWHGVRVHQAATMALAPFWKGFTNIPEDADTTSVTYAARYFTSRIAGQAFNLPADVPASFSRFRDLNREAQWYNRQQHMVNTGAFLTWQFDEKDPNMPRFYFAEPEEGKRIPFNDNDVDCIVNLNVLRMLALTGNSAIAGHDSSCGLMAYVVLSKDYAACGMYYPNTYYFPYEASLVDKAGDHCLSPYVPKMLDYVLHSRYSDGGWSNRDNVHNDRIQATAFSVYTLAHFGDARSPEIRSALAAGSKFLVAQSMRSTTGNVYWPGEVFFTATAIARSQVDWKSNAFTTALVLSALLEADKALNNGAVQRLQ
jgi:hypothetical protein